MLELEAEVARLKAEVARLQAELDTERKWRQELEEVSIDLAVELDHYRRKHA